MDNREQQKKEALAQLKHTLIGGVLGSVGAYLIFLALT